MSCVAITTEAVTRWRTWVALKFFILSQFYPQISLHKVLVVLKKLLTNKNLEYDTELIRHLEFIIKNTIKLFEIIKKFWSTKSRLVISKT